MGVVMMSTIVYSVMPCSVVEAHPKRRRTFTALHGVTSHKMILSPSFWTFHCHYVPIYITLQIRYLAYVIKAKINI
jgi:hypothetical protein